MLALNNVSLRRGVKLVLDGASVVLQPGEKVGLVGRNGAGKSSLFSLLTHRLQSDAGDVSMPPRWRIGEVAQDMPETDQGATDFVLAGDLPLPETAVDAIQRYPLPEQLPADQRHSSLCFFTPTAQPPQCGTLRHFQEEPCTRAT